MIDGSTIVKQRQLAIRREMDRRGIALKVVAMDSKVPYSSLASYFPADSKVEPAQIPGGVIHDLCGHLPGDLLSLLLPTEFHIVRGPSDIDHDAIGEWAEEYCNRKLAAHRADSEMAERIGPNERASLNASVATFPARAA